jgi:hypothetical protein
MGRRDNQGKYHNEINDIFAGGGPGRIGIDIEIICFLSKCDTLGGIEREKKFLANAVFQLDSQRLYFSTAAGSALDAAKERLLAITTCGDLACRTLGVIWNIGSEAPG